MTMRLCDRSWFSPRCVQSSSLFSSQPTGSSGSSNREKASALFQLHSGFRQKSTVRGRRTSVLAASRRGYISRGDTIQVKNCVASSFVAYVGL